ncbi:early nodulin-like protein 12 [Salvia miltiorrhiza]|uniref:early nodulin-like protein 12 n=1 Tax=Salvia miltiorrhiza TaxID=226208 RepID=UPI0025ACE896|nr:early nodulin-like protein 12 [Salvia miltiorrhiza]
MAFWKTLVLFLALLHSSQAREFHVIDDKASWQIPSSPDAFDKWAQNNRFEIGDSIVFKYDGKADSVVEVSEADFKTCSASNPIKSFSDGNTVIALDKSGPLFFISAAPAHCQKGQKLHIRVLSANHHHHHRPAAAPAPSPIAHHSPAPAPAPHNAAAVALRAGFLAAAAMALASAALV